ncbi:acyl carrier protein [Kitasatospora azatica]|uniref:acyl carrier protein n=1 Tax=Kitasatospora azatica TaxID=58347 RepID=UPI00055C3869|nr:acyl carrier protein [Kitasatospora azatica]
MTEMSLSTLIALLVECAGEEEGVDLNGDILDVPFVELGYDSLAVLQTSGRIERDYGIQLSDDTVAEAYTPRLLLEFVNESLSAATAAAA